MKEILEPLALIPGVRMAVLVSTDGVPIAVRGTNTVKESSPDEWTDSTEDANALAGLAAGFLNEVTRSVAPLSWNTPQRLILHATRGSVVMLHAPGAVLLVVLESGMRAEELALPMEAAVARMMRVLRSMGKGSESTATAEVDGPPGIFPSGKTQVQPGVNEVQTRVNEVPEHSGE